MERLIDCCDMLSRDRGIGVNVREEYVIIKESGVDAFFPCGWCEVCGDHRCVDSKLGDFFNVSGCDSDSFESPEITQPKFQFTNGVLF